MGFLSGLWEIAIFIIIGGITLAALYISFFGIVAVVLFFGAIFGFFD